MRHASKFNVMTLIVGMIAGALMFGGASIAANTIGSADIKDGAVKKRDLSKGVVRSIDKKATDAQLAALTARVAKLEAAQQAVNNGTGNANFTGGPGTTVTPTTATMTLAAGDADGRAGYRYRSRLMSSDGAEWVSAPTEMRSTPVSATARTVASVMPPLASVIARPPTRATASRSSSTDMLSSRTASAPAVSAASSCSNVSTSTSIQRPWQSKPFW